MGFFELKNFLKNTKVYLAYPFFLKKEAKILRKIEKISLKF